MTLINRIRLYEAKATNKGIEFEDLNKQLKQLNGFYGQFIANFWKEEKITLKNCRRGRNRTNNYQAISVIATKVFGSLLFFFFIHEKRKKSSFIHINVV